MIERNLGNAERLIRLIFGLSLGGWMISRPDINGMEIFVVIVALSLILNGIFSRCYLWYILDIDTSGRVSSDCQSQRV